MVARHQRAIVEASAEIARLGIGDDLPRVVGCLEVARDHLAQRQPFGAGDLDRVVERRAERSVRHGLGDIVGSDGLEAGIREANTCVVGASSGDGAEKFEELRGPDDSRASDRGGQRFIHAATSAQGQKPRPLQLKATTMSSLHCSHRTWTHPCSSRPQRR